MDDFSPGQAKEEEHFIKILTYDPGEILFDMCACVLVCVILVICIHF